MAQLVQQAHKDYQVLMVQMALMVQLAQQVLRDPKV